MLLLMLLLLLLLLLEHHLLLKRLQLRLLHGVRVPGFTLIPLGGGGRTGGGGGGLKSGGSSGRICMRPLFALLALVSE